jgi:hypothetical protein
MWLMLDRGQPNSLSKEETAFLQRSRPSIKNASKFPAQAADTACPVLKMSAFQNALRSKIKLACSMRRTLPPSITISKYQIVHPLFDCSFLAALFPCSLFHKASEARFLQAEDLFLSIILDMD